MSDEKEFDLTKGKMEYRMPEDEQDWFTLKKRAEELLAYAEERKSHCSKMGHSSDYIHYSGWVKALRELLYPQPEDGGNKVTFM